MPSNPKSLRITDRYRAGMVGLRRRGQTAARRAWKQVNPDDIDGTFPVGSLTATVTALQREAARLSSAYLAAYVASELGEPQSAPPVMVHNKTFNGGNLREGLLSATIKAKIKIRDGMDPRDAVNAAGAILVSDVGLFIDTAAREPLRQGMEADDRIVGYQRAIRGTCAACAGDTEYEAFSPGAPVVELKVHPNCQCVAEPSVTPQSGTTLPRTPLTDGQINTMGNYLSSSRSFAINAHLRGREAPPSAIPMTPSEVNANVNAMDEVFDSVDPVGTPVQLFRGARSRPSEFGLPIPAAKMEGQIFTDPGFVSTSTNLDWASSRFFASDNVAGHSTLFDLTLSPKVKAIVGHGDAREAEVLLQRGCRFLVTKVEREGKRWKVSATVLPPA